MRSPTSRLGVNAGHGINYQNIAEVRTLTHLHELNIGHTIVSRALFCGIKEAVREMRALMAELAPRRPPDRSVARKCRCPMAGNIRRTKDFATKRGDPCYVAVAAG